MRTKSTPTLVHAPGLCLNCAIAMAAVVPAALREGLEASRTAHRELWMDWLRCESCPIHTFNSSRFPPDISIGKPWIPSGHCADCSEECRITLHEQFPFLPRPLLPYAPVAAEDMGLWVAYFEAEVVVQDAYRDGRLAWPRCDDCPGIIPSTKPKEAPGLETQVLNALAAEGTMSAGDLLTLGIKGLNKNNISRLMGRLVGDGLVIVTHKGPAKLYTLA